jgi:hypothetical protein
MKTKPALLLAILFFTCTSVAHAQKGWSIAFSITPHGSTGGDYEVPVDAFNPNTPFVPMEKELQAGINVGADVHYFFSDKAGVSFGVHYAGLGVDYRNYVWSYSGVSVTLNKNTSLHYVQFPVLFHYTDAPAKKASFVAEAGFYIGVLTGYHDEFIFTGSNGVMQTIVAEDGNFTYTTTSGYYSQTETGVFNSDPFTSGDAGGIIGAGMQFHLSEKVFMPVMLTYQAGFSDVKNKSSQYTSGGDTYSYWDDGIGTRPNLTLHFKNAAIGLKLGIVVKL